MSSILKCILSFGVFPAPAASKNVSNSLGSDDIVGSDDILGSDDTTQGTSTAPFNNSITDITGSTGEVFQAVQVQYNIA